MDSLGAATFGKVPSGPEHSYVSHWKLSSTSFERESFREIAKKKVASHVGKSSAPVYQGK